MFKIIAIQSLPILDEKYILPDGVAKEKRFEIDLRRSRHDSVMKVLQSDTWFWLEKDYAYENEEIVCKGNILPDDFFSNGVPYITVSAIVGKPPTNHVVLYSPFYHLLETQALHKMGDFLFVHHIFLTEKSLLQ